MRIKNFPIFIAVLVAASAVALGTTTSAFAVLPTITIINNGGAGQVPTKGTRKCEYGAKSEVCKLVVTNTSAFEVKLFTEPELTPPEGSTRYKVENSSCTNGTKLAAKVGVCTVEIKREAASPPCAQLNGYAVEVEEEGNPANHVRESAFLEMS